MTAKLQWVAVYYTHATCSWYGVTRCPLRWQLIQGYHETPVRLVLKEISNVFLAVLRLVVLDHAIASSCLRTNSIFKKCFNAWSKKSKLLIQLDQELGDFNISI